MSKHKENPGRESRATRRQREARSQLYQRIALGLTAVAVAVGGAWLWFENFVSPSQALNAEVAFQATEESAIKQASESLGAEESTREQDIWASAYGEPGYFTPITEESMVLAQTRVNDTLARMRLSQNPYYKDTTAYLDSLVDDNRSVMFIDPILDEIDNEKSLGASVSTKFGGDGRLRYVLVLSQDFILNDSTALTLADLVVHEVDHLKRFKTFVEGLPTTMTDVQKEDYFRENYLPQAGLVNEEAKAYAVQAESYIYQTGLMGYLYAEQISGTEERAHNYLLNGRNAESPGWKTYLQSILSSLR